jgi:hypothetical protein
MKSNRAKLPLILTLSLVITSCSKTEDVSESEYLGKANARATIAEVRIDYLNCYAREGAAKKECLDPLIAKYNKNTRRNDAEYLQAFQFESEKLGFKHFLNSLNLPCESINDGPEFMEEKQAYLVKCSSSQQYFMQFNYDNNQWKLIKGESNNER